MHEVARRLRRSISYGCWSLLLYAILLGCEKGDSYRSAATSSNKSSEETTAKKQQWPKETLENYNPHALTNAQGCPQIPGTFFKEEENSCITFLPAMSEDSTTLKGNPAYRYSVAIKEDETGKRLFNENPTHQARCDSNPKIDYLQKALSKTFTVEVTSGEATVDLPENPNIAADGVVCRVVATPLKQAQG